MATKPSQLNPLLIVTTAVEMLLCGCLIVRDYNGSIGQPFWVEKFYIGRKSSTVNGGIFQIIKFAWKVSVFYGYKLEEFGYIAESTETPRWFGGSDLCERRSFSAFKCGILSR